MCAGWRANLRNLRDSLPILVQPEFVRQALAAGKHVLSEKPIAKDVATAQDLIAWYKANVDGTKTLWAVAENFRYVSKFVRAAEEVRKLGGVKNLRVNVRNLIKTDSKYYSRFFSLDYLRVSPCLERGPFG